MTSEQYGQSTANGGMKIQSTGVVKNMFNKEFSTWTFGGNSGAPPVLPMPGPNVNQVNQVVAGGNVAQSNNIHKKRWMSQVNQIAAGGNVAQSNNFNANSFFPKPYANQVNQIVAGNNVAQSNHFHKKRFTQHNSGTIRTQINNEYGKGAAAVLPNPPVYVKPGPNVNQVNQVVAGNNVAQSNRFHKKRFLSQVNQIAAGGNVAQSNNFNANPFFPKPYANQVNQIVAGNNVAQ